MWIANRFYKKTQLQQYISTHQTPPKEFFIYSKLIRDLNYHIIFYFGPFFQDLAIEKNIGGHEDEGPYYLDVPIEVAISLVDSELK